MSDGSPTGGVDIPGRYQAAVKALEARQEEWWNSLTKEEQLNAFCAVSRRIYQGEIQAKGTYRYVLYDVFGFGPESYMAAQEAGYLAIHNSIYDDEYESKMLYAFCVKWGIEDADRKVTEFLI